MKYVFNVLAKTTILFMAITLCAFAVKAAPQTVRGIQDKPTYQFDFNAPREVVKITSAICVQFGFAANGVSQAISMGESNNDIKMRLFNAAKVDLSDKNGLTAATMMISVIDASRKWDTAADYKYVSRTYPKFNRHEIYQVVAESRCLMTVGNTVSISKVVRVDETSK